jgi:YVTN family beta-propeller protein
VVGDIPGTDGVHAIALADKLNVGFTSNGKSNSVTVFDLTTLKMIQTIKISGLNPDAILYEPSSQHVFSFNGHSANVSVIDAVSLKEITTIQLPGKPELAVSNDAGNIYVNIEDKNEIAVIDSSSNKVLKVYSLGNGDEPTGLAIDKQHHRLFSVCANNKMEILDSDTGTIIAEVVIGSGPDSAAFDPDLGIAFSSNGDGTLTLVKEHDPDHFSVDQNVTTQKGARTMAYDSDKHRVYLVTASFGETPAATDEQPKPRPAIIPDSFVVLVISIETR